MCSSIMRDYKFFFGAAFFTLLVVSCTNQQTKIELLSDADVFLGDVPIKARSLPVYEWIFQNVGEANLRIDSVELSCECLKADYDSVNSVSPNGYLPFRVYITPEGTLGGFYREIRIFGNFENSPLELSLEGTFVDGENIEE